MDDATTTIGTGLAGRSRRIVGEVQAAFALLTRLPVGAAGADLSGASAFALVGAFVGIAGAIPVMALGGTEPLLAAVAAVAVMALVSGALHLDGLADTADALLVADRARADHARKDPAIGPGGAVALTLVLAAQVASLASLASAGPVLAAVACVVAGTVSRVVPVVVAATVDDRAAASGLGAWFMERIGTRNVVVAVASAVAIVAATALIAGSAIPAVGAVSGAIVGLLVGRAIVATRGQLDGDGLGAGVELAFAATLAACAIAAP